MKKICFLITALLTCTLAFAQPANDNCSTAQAIGSLLTPAACPSGLGSSLTIAGTLNGATAANPYTYQGTGCTGTSTTMASPAIDVWYTFVATGYQLSVVISGSVVNPNIAMYSGTCASLGGGVGGCAVGTAGGATTLTVQQMIPGTTYYLQVSGNTSTGTGNFSMNISNLKACNDCLGATNLTVTPPPTNGAYAPGTTVNFCYKVNGYTQVNTNWLHGVQMAFGTGWNTASITTTPPPACQGTGYWLYYPAGITDNTGQAWPAGFYFETVTGQNNPGNNFGDNCSGTISAANWNFCFSITTAAACSPGSDLSVVINTSGDGESGSWSNLGCSVDPATVFHAIGTCCPPTMSSTPVSCNGGSDGTATATPVGTQSPYNYSWTNSSGVVVSTTSGVAGANTATGLPAGTYTVSVTDKNNCLSTNTVTVTQPTPVTLNLTPTNPSCGSNNGNISSVAGGGTPGYTYSLNGGGFAAPSSFPALAAGSYTVVVHDSKGCAATATVSLVTAGSTTVTANPATICNGGSTILTGSGATTYTWSANAGSANTNTVSVNPSSTTIYTVSGSNGGCVGTVTLTVTVNPLPTINVTNGTICNGGSVALTASGASTYTWSPATGLSTTTGANVNANPAVTTPYTVTGTDANGCVNTGTTTVTVSGNPTITVNTATICIGQQTATLTASGATNYTWTPATGLSTTTGSVVLANPTTTIPYTITGAIGTCTATATTTVTVNPLPTITVNTATICVGQQIANLNAAGATIYTWTPGTGLSSTSTPSITANPATTTAYTVGGVDANGCASFATTTVTVNPLPTIILNSALICNGASTPLTASGATSYTWTPATGLSTTNGALVNASPTTTTSYSVLGTDANGCINGDSNTVTVVNNPVISVTTGTICVGQQTTTLTASGATSYVWSPAGGLSSTIGTSVVANPGASTIYTIIGTIGTCTASSTTTVTVNTPAVPTIGSNGPVCVNQTMNLTSGGAVSYVWTGPNGFNSPQQNPSITGTTIAASGIYTVAIIDANTCVNTATVNVVVNPLPVVTVTGSTVCLNGTINLTANGGVSYSWSGPGAYNSNQQNPSITNAAATMAGTYVVTVTDANNCVNANVAQVSINPLPTIIVTSGNVCAGNSATLTASGANTYNWSPATGLNVTTGTLVIANPATTSSYTVTGTDNNNCQNTATLTVSVNPSPAVVIGPQTITGCAPVCVTFSNTAAGTGTCSWNFGDGTTSTSCNPTNCFTAQGYYTISLTVTDNNGCIGTSSANVTVYPVPHADFNATPQPTTVLDNNIHFFDATTVAVITSWNWNLGNGTTSTTQNPSCLYADTGSYAVQLTVISNHGCKDSTIKIIRIDEDYSLYVPNAFSPNSDGVNDIFYAKGEGIRDFKMYIFDRWGNQVFFSDNIYKGWDGRYQAKGIDIVQEDVYVWKIEVKNIRGEKRQLSGHVSLIK